jgi:hypothetical protein
LLLEDERKRVLRDDLFVILHDATLLFINRIGRYIQDAIRRIVLSYHERFRLLLQHPQRSQKDVLGGENSCGLDSDYY